MEIAKLYGSLVRRQIEKRPALAARLIRLGLHLEGFRCRHLADRRLPEAYKLLNYKGITLVADALDHPQTYCWTNIFAPVELLECFDLTSVSMECMSSYLSGFYLEDYFIDYAEQEGIAPTLCAYHRTFIGAVDAGVIPNPLLAVTTSMVCDGNISTFRYLGDRHQVPCYVIDIPHEATPEAIDYVEMQLQELIGILEEKTGKPFDPERLTAILERENRSKSHFLSYMKKRQLHHYPSTLTLIVFQLFATHLNIGTEWVDDLFEIMDREVTTFPEEKGKRLFWVHLEPYAQPVLRSYLNFGENVSIAGGDFDLDYTQMLDTAHPLKALARKMIDNIYNGDYVRKADAVAEMVQTYQPDGVVAFCTWGCKQSAGGVGLLRERMAALGVPMLVLDGDAIDRRSCPDGQIKTRFEAFLEMLEDKES